MASRRRVLLSLSPEAFEALVYEAQRVGLTVSTYAASQVYRAIAPTFSTRDYERWRKEQGIESQPGTWRAEARMIERMAKAEEAQECPPAQNSTAKRQRT